MIELCLSKPIFSAKAECSASYFVKRRKIKLILLDKLI